MNLNNSQPYFSEWKSYPNHSLYLISPKGEVYNRKRKRFLKTLFYDRYKVVGLYNDEGIRLTKHLHRIVAEIYVPNPLNLPEVNHEDGDRGNCSADNLKWVTSSQNSIHSFKHNLRSTIGERHFNTHLKNSDVDQIRLSKKSSSDLSKQFKISPSTVRRIINNKTWKKI